MFEPERALTDAEIDHLTFMAQQVWDKYPTEIYEATIALDVWAYEGRTKMNILSDLAEKDVRHEYPFIQQWVSYVQQYLETEAYIFGYGYVGWSVPNEPYDGPTLAIEGR